jgi:DNA mismatch endonuclease (patch repair protein)
MPYKFKTTLTRSRNMQAIRSTNNATTERKIRAHLSQLAIKGWRIRPSSVPGSPDFVFPSVKIALFVDGCFWHSCPRCGHIPKSNVKYWKAKLTRNKIRDRRVNRELRSAGFTVIRYWECALKRDPRKCLNKLLRLLPQGSLGLRAT